MKRSYSDFCLVLITLLMLHVITRDVSRISVQGQETNYVEYQDTAYTPITDEESPAGDSIADVKSLQADMEKLQKQLEDLKKTVDKKQNSTDTSKKFNCKVNGLMFIDANFVNQDSENKMRYWDVQNNLGLSDLRIGVKGEGYGILDYNLTVGLNEDVSLKDAYVGVKNVPYLDYVRFGHFKVESGIGYLTGVFDQNFDAYDTVSNTFRVGRRVGAGATRLFAGDRIRVFGGIFSREGFDYDTYVNDDCAGIILNTRITGLPVYREDGDGNLKEVLHCGGCFYWARSDRNILRLRNQPTTWYGATGYLLTGTLPANFGSCSVSNLELAWQKDGFGIQSENFVGSYEGYGNAYGVTLTGRYFLTPGAYITYKKDRGTFSGVHMDKNLQVINLEDRVCFEGWGALELIGYWGYTDLDNLRYLPGSVYGSSNEFITGMNWYWNPQMRVSLNWIHTIVCSSDSMAAERGESTADTLSLQLRMQY